MNIKDKLKTEKEWLENSKMGLKEETTKISTQFDWTQFEFFLWHIKTTIGKIDILEELIKDEENAFKNNT